MPVTSLDAVCGLLARVAPLRLAEDWDNVGLLVGDRRQGIERVMTCLTLSPNVVQEAVDQKVDLVVVHHPLPFQPVKKITSDSITGSMLLDLISSKIAVYSAHTAFDSAAGGINQTWGELLGLRSIKPLVEAEPASANGNPASQAAGPVAANQQAGAVQPLGAVQQLVTEQPLGSGRFGRLSEPETLGTLIRRAASAVGATAPRIVGDAHRQVSKVAIACGSGGSFLSVAARHGCDAMITGEATFHTCLEAQSRGIGLGLLGHYFSERFAMERLGVTIGAEMPDLSVWASKSEHDPLRPIDLDD